MYPSQGAKHASINEVLPSEIWNWFSGFVETPKSAMALATVREEYDNHCGYINCWVDGRLPNCKTACVWRMYKFCRIVAEMASKLWRYVNVFNEFILHRGFFNLRIGSDLNEDSEDEVVCVGGDSCHIYFQCGDLGHSFDGRTWVPTCCLADELCKALKYHTIARGETRCTLERGFSARMDASRMDVLRNKIEDLSNHCPEGILIAVEVNATTRHRYARSYEVKITLTDEEHKDMSHQDRVPTLTLT